MLLVLVFGILVYVKVTAPKPVDWRQTFDRKDKIPYGTYVLYNTIGDVFEDKEVTVLREDIYYFTENYFEQLEEDPLYRTNLFYIGEWFQADDYELENLLLYVAEGNHAFISATNFSRNLLDSLNIVQHYQYGGFNSGEEDSISFNFVNPSLKAAEPYHISGKLSYNYFNSIRNDSAVVLGKIDGKLVNFIRIKHGKGWLYLHSFPFAFTNYSILKGENAEYAYAALSYMPVADTYWGEYGMGAGNSEEASGSLLKYILSNSALSWAYYILLASLLLYVFFEGKRRQKIIPVLEPLKNTTVEFTETIGRLYYHKKDHKNLADKKISYFLEYLRNHLYVRTTELNKSLIRALNMKTGIPETELSELFVKINYIRNSAQITAEDLLELNDKIDEFYKRTR